MKTYLKIAAATLLMLFTVQCEVIDSDLLTDPNNVSPENVDADFLTTSIQLSARGIYSGAALRGAQLTRQRRHFGSTYENALSGENMSGLYNTTYASVFADVETLRPLAEENDLFFHLGMAEFFKAYGLINMVDLFGDVPLSEALDAGNFNPSLDNSADVYDRALELLDSAIANFQNENRLNFPTDLYYSNQSGEDKVASWVRAANTLKLRAYMNMRNVDPQRATAGINGLLNDPIGLITEPAHDFTFQYSTNDTDPDARHPLFTNNYLDGANNYIGTSIMHIMLNDKEDRDPRLRYYFYRQRTENTTDVNEQSCLASPPPSHYTDDDPWCQLEDGYWGQGHLNTEGIPPDNFARTVFGIYPAGGEFDFSAAQNVNSGMGYEGAGIRPIFMSSFTHFMLAEAGLTLDGVNVDARQFMIQGIERSINTVVSFGAQRLAELDVAGLAPSAGAIQRYIDEASAKFDANPMRAIALEYYIASFPNGIEAYNLMRRSGFPNRADGIQPALNSDPGQFNRTLPYAASLVNRNSNVSQKASNHVRTFWDVREPVDEFDF